jgi:hypothetical protein
MIQHTNYVSAPSGSFRVVGAKVPGTINGWVIKTGKTDMRYAHEQRTTRKAFRESSRWLGEPPR